MDIWRMKTMPEMMPIYNENMLILLTIIGIPTLFLLVLIKLLKLCGIDLFAGLERIFLEDDAA